SLREIHVPLERESCGKLQNARKAVRADLLQASEIARARIWHQIADLVERSSIAAVAPNGVVLQLINAVAVLHVVVGVVEQIERLHLKFQFLAFLDFKTSRQPNVNPLQPGAIERVQTDAGRGASAIDACGGVRRSLIKSAVI